MTVFAVPLALPLAFLGGFILSCWFLYNILKRGVDRPFDPTEEEIEDEEIEAEVLAEMQAEAEKKKRKGSAAS